ncbi:MAG: hypothetical protein HYV60_00655 [Planctomycetia bacterium]|nr:hypothetical protein [Planctomycetia bacterium]
MAKARVTREDFLEDPQGRTFADVVNDPEQPFDSVLAFLAAAGRRRFGPHDHGTPRLAEDGQKGISRCASGRNC